MAEEGPIVRHLILAILLLSTATGGILLGYHLRGPSPELVDALKTHDLKLDAFGQRLERVERRQHSELMALAAGQQPAAPPTGEAVAKGALDRVPVDEPEPPSAESEEALERGRTMIDQALQTGEWTEANALALRSIASLLNAEQQHLLFSELSRHFNDANLRYDGFGPPF